MVFKDTDKNPLQKFCTSLPSQEHQGSDFLYFKGGHTM